MGYTHYWRFNDQDSPSLESRKRISETLQHLYDNRYRLFGDAAVDLAVEYNEHDMPPENSVEYISFNGRGDDGHETFLMDWKHGSTFEFCKTAMKPYDFWVVTTLMLIHTELPNALSIRSDGSEDDWKVHLDLLSTVLKDEVEKHPHLINPNPNIAFDEDTGILTTLSEPAAEKDIDNESMGFNSFF